MAQTGAVFGGEHSGHFYFRDFWRADSGMLAALHTLAALGNQPAGEQRPLSELLREYSRYVASGEINSHVDDQRARMTAIEQAFSARDGVQIDHLDGLTVELGDGSWFNVRPSNTEPLLRLNVEAPDESSMSVLRDEVLGLVRAG
jgi:phosphomannomutase